MGMTTYSDDPDDAMELWERDNAAAAAFEEERVYQEWRDRMIEDRYEGDLSRAGFVDWSLARWEAIYD